MEKDLSVSKTEVGVALVLRKGVTLGRYHPAEGTNSKIFRSENFCFTEIFQAALAYCMLHGNKSSLKASIECDKCSLGL